MTAPARCRGRVGGVAVHDVRSVPSVSRAVANEKAEILAKKPRKVSDVSAISEAAFQRSVVASLRSRGWIVWTVPNMRMTTRGLPDLLCVHPQRPGRLLAWELKGERTRVRPEQKVVLEALSTVPGVDARIVRPSQWRALSEEV